MIVTTVIGLFKTIRNAVTAVAAPTRLVSPRLARRSPAI